MRCRWGTKKIIITPGIYGNIIFNLNSLYRHCFCFVSGLRSLHNEGHEINRSLWLYVQVRVCANHKIVTIIYISDVLLD